MENLRSGFHLGRDPIRVLPLVRLLFFLSLMRGLTLSNRLRQYPLYSKPAPPAVLAEHFKADVFEKSQKYGKDKAKFSLVSGLLKQCLDSAMLQYGFYAWSWDMGGRIIARLGYGPQYEVRFVSRLCSPFPCR